MDVLGVDEELLMASVELRGELLVECAVGLASFFLFIRVFPVAVLRLCLLLPEKVEDAEASLLLFFLFFDFAEFLLLFVLFSLRLLGLQLGLMLLDQLIDVLVRLGSLPLVAIHRLPLVQLLNSAPL